MKNLLLTICFLLIAGKLVAQLHVKPNPVSNTDSFVYSKDVVIYVEGAIDLIANNQAETSASIYLRGDAQLIQGDKATSINSGTGSISVLQSGWANAYDYNYWGSPVGIPNVSTGNRNFAITRFFDVQDNGTHPTHSIQQQTITSLNGQSNPLRISSSWIYTLRGSNAYSSWFHIGSSSNLAPGEGFTMKGTRTDVDAHAQLYDFRGRPNDGDITVPVYHNGTEGLSTLVGNPYPSALDLSAFLLENTDITAQILYWDQDRTTNSHYIYDYQGGYGVWVPAGGDDIGDGTTSGTYSLPVFTSTDGYGSPGSPTGVLGVHVQRRFAPIGQGFVVIGDESIAGVSGSVTFNNSMRRHVGLGAANFSQFRTLSTGSDDNAPANFITAKINGTLRFHVKINNTYYRDMVLMFSNQSTNGYDRGMDATHPSVIETGDAFWKLENRNEPFVIQTRPFDFHSKIPINFRVRNGKNSFKINLVEMKGFENFRRLELYLYDELLGIYQALDRNKQAIIYRSGSEGIIEDRYYIVFRKQQGNDPINDEYKKRLTSVDIFQNNPLSKLQVTNPDMLDIKSALVYDMRGRLVINQQNIGKVRHYEFSTQGLSSGVYVVMLTTQDSQIMDYKITIHNKN